MKIISNEWKLRYVIIVLRNQTQWTKMIQHHFTISTYCPQSIVGTVPRFYWQRHNYRIKSRKKPKVNYAEVSLLQPQVWRPQFNYEQLFSCHVTAKHHLPTLKSYIETGNVKGAFLDEEEIFVKQWNTLFDCDLTVWRRSSSESETLIWILCVLCFFDAIVHAHFYSYFFVLNCDYSLINFHKVSLFCLEFICCSKFNSYWLTRLAGQILLSDRPFDWLCGLYDTFLLPSNLRLT